MPQRRRLSRAEWPVQDRELFARAVSPTDYFDTSAAGSHWRPKTRYQVEAAYGTWLAFLAATDPDALSEDLVDRTSRLRMRPHVDQMAARVTQMSVAAHLNHLVIALHALAPDHDWSWLRKEQRRWQRQARPRERRRKLVHTMQLIELGEALIAAAPTQARMIDQARMYRDGLLIALLASRPMRVRSWSLLEIDRHVLPVGDGGYSITIPAEDTKAARAEEFSVPTSLLPQFTLYLTHYRLLLPAACEHKALWASTQRGALGAEAIYDMVCQRTLASFGFTVTPHLFRHCAATTIAREAPELLPVASGLLAHARLDTTSNYYTPANTVAAARQHAEVLANLRGRLATTRTQRRFDRGAGKSGRTEDPHRSLAARDGCN